MAGDALHGTNAPSDSLSLSPSTHCHSIRRTQSTRLAPGIAPVLLADACILTNVLHAHAQARPNAALRWRVPHPLNCRPSALEVILPFHYHATSHVPARSSHSRPRCPSASCACTSAMHQRNRPGGCGGRNRPDSNPSSRGKLVGAPVQRSDVRIPMMCKIISAPNLGNWVFFKP